VTQIRPDSSPVAHGFVRDPQTLAVYVLLALLTSGYGIIGPLMPFLRAELGLTFTQGSYHTVALAVGTMAIGLGGQRLVAALGRGHSIALTLVLMAVAQVMMTQARILPVSLAASVLFGATVALSICVVPAVMSERHGPRLGLAIAEANTIAYLGVLVVPGIVSMSEAAIGWRWSFALPVAAYGLYWLSIRRLDFGVARPPVKGPAAGRLTAAYWWYWTMLTLGISAEFGLMVWGASFLETVAALPRDLALWASMIFPLGMVAGRIVGTLIMRHHPARRLALPTLALAMAGVLLLVLTERVLISGAGLFLAGMGIANLYPVGITLAMQAAPDAADAAAARASLASGSAILFAPLVLGAIADSAGLAAAFAVIPVLLVLAGFSLLAGHRAASVS